MTFTPAITPDNQRVIDAARDGAQRVLDDPNASEAWRSMARETISQIDALPRLDFGAGRERAIDGLVAGGYSRQAARRIVSHVWG